MRWSFSMSAIIPTLPYPARQTDVVGPLRTTKPRSSGMNQTPRAAMMAALLKMADRFSVQALRALGFFRRFAVDGTLMGHPIGEVSVHPRFRRRKTNVVRQKPPTPLL